MVFNQTWCSIRHPTFPDTTDRSSCVLWPHFLFKSKEPNNSCQKLLDEDEDDNDKDKEDDGDYDDDNNNFGE